MDTWVPMRASRRLVAVLAVFFGLYLVVGSLSYAFPDFLDHSMAATRIASGEMLYRDHVAYINVYHYPPVYLYGLGALYAVVGTDMLAAKGVLALFTVLSAWTLFEITARLLDDGRAWFATGCFLLNPVTFVGVYGGYFDAFVAFFVLLSFLLLLEDHSLLAGAALSLGFMSKPFPALFIPLVAAFYLRSGRGSDRGTDRASDSGLDRRSDRGPGRGPSRGSERESEAGSDWGTVRGTVRRTDREWLGGLGRFLAAFGAVVVAVSLPFLLVAPRAYVRYAFLYNFQRVPASLSLYYYVLPWLASTPATVVLPGGFVAWVSAALVRSRVDAGRVLLEGSGVLLLGFLLLNRINYPHYLVYLVPFLSFALARQYTENVRVAGIAAWKHTVVAFGTVLAGAAVWAYPWRMGRFEFRTSPLFWIGAGIFFLGACYLLAVLARSLDERWFRWPTRGALYGE